MNAHKKIGWQKYEDVLQDQLDSPLLEAMMKKLAGEQIVTDEEMKEIMEAEGVLETRQMIPIDEKTMENIYLANNFDCWMGHTNFNISKTVMDALCEMEGVEILKVCSRYRFFLGVGRMFDFSNVRQNIEKLFLIKEVKNEGKTSGEVPE